MKWLITILSPDGLTLLFHALCEDEKECQALATEARHHNLRTKIWIRDPFGQLRPWD